MPSLPGCVGMWALQHCTLTIGLIPRTRSQVKYIEGLLNFWDGIRDAKPGAVVDGCSGGVYRHVCRHAYRHVGRHVYTHVGRHVYTHVCAHVYTHVTYC